VQIAKYLTADNSVFPYSNANDMRVTQDLNSFGEIIAPAHFSVDENNVGHSYYFKGTLSAKIVNFCYPKKLSDMIDALIKRVSVTYTCYEMYAHRGKKGATARVTISH
jgi:hypothetical protein